MSASVKSWTPADVALISRTRARTAAGSYAIGSGVTIAAFPLPPAMGAKSFGLRLATAGARANDTFCVALPAYTGRVATRRPPSTASAVQSAASPTPSRAATRGARSRPIELAANNTALGATFSTAATTAFTIPDGS